MNHDDRTALLHAIQYLDSRLIGARKIECDAHADLEREVFGANDGVIAMKARQFIDAERYHKAVREFEASLQLLERAVGTSITMERAIYVVESWEAMWSLVPHDKKGITGL